MLFGYSRKHCIIIQRLYILFKIFLNSSIISVLTFRGSAGLINTFLRIRRLRPFCGALGGPISPPPLDAKFEKYL